MASVLSGFRRKEQFDRRSWYRGAFILEDLSVNVGDARRIQISAAHRLLRRLASSLTRRDSIFIGTTGLILDLARRRKVVAIEFSCTRRAQAAAKVASIFEDFGDGVTALAPHENITRNFGDSAFLHEILLYNYIKRSLYSPARPSCFKKKDLLCEVAQNYGVHRVCDRVVTFGVGVQANRLVQAPGCCDQLDLTAFGDLLD
ncbi:hypothetical protein [Neorhizobium sp. T25_27]|uniref:hypothetical protein n=1 Tax=Neorhizobium sp. T25_27 TaxID=2093831 RepID=UPI00155E71FB|nr:hypothetical protein [Neorhizobium sp. T25_27]